MSVNVLPDMDEPRLKTLGKQLNRNRKASLISTGKTKEKLDVYVKSLSKAQRALDGKYKKRSTRLKHSLANVRGTQKVLKARREQSFWEDSDEYPFGIYQGEKLDSYRREIENIIDSKHPKIRRQKKVEHNLSIGKVRGKLIDNDDAKHQFNLIMSKDRKSEFISRENTLTRPYFSKSVPDKIADYFKRLNDFGSEHSRDYDSDTCSNRLSLNIRQKTIHPHTRIEKLKLDDDCRTDSRSSSHVCSPTDVKVGNLTGNSNRLNLPAISVKKDHVSDKYMENESPSRSYLPKIAIRRATKGEITPLRNSKEIMTLDRLKARRATTLM